MPTTTAEHFALFAQFHREYMERYGLLQWRIQYHHAVLDGAFAETTPSFKGKVATVSLTKTWGKIRPLNETELRKVAKHEVNHLLLFSLYWHAQARYIHPDTLQEAEEAIVRTLDNLIPD